MIGDVQRYDDIHGNGVFKLLTYIFLGAFGLLFALIEVNNAKQDKSKMESAAATNCP